MDTEQDIINKYPDIDINTDGGSDEFKPGLPIVERDPIAVIIKHPTDDLYLLADWKQSEWKGFLTGGIEEGDTLEDTVRKEIHEETGFRNVARIIPTDFQSHALFFHPVKNVNRLAHYHLVIAQLADLDRDEVAEEEQKIADFIWVPYARVEAVLTRKGIKQLWNYYCENQQLFTELV
ncbi:MAG: NUDIX hydrolase [Candidatus Pacebacteria bacterium]|nr:NUDIX hydrolase [Candidatus Paceibacterota bacterium]